MSFAPSPALAAGLRRLLLRLLAWIAAPLARRPSPRIERVLYLKPDHLGDLLLATPVLTALRHAMPQAQITALVGPWSQVILERNPDIDAVAICPFPGFERGPRPGGPLRPYWLLLRYALLLRAGRYDLAIIGRDDHWWGAALALLAGIPRRIGFAVPECRPFLTDALAWDPRDHVTEQGLALVVAAAGSAPARPAMRFTPRQADQDWAAAWLQAQQRDQAARLVIIHPGTAGPDKHWLPERWIALADQLSAHEPQAQVVLTGGPGEEQLVEQIATGMAVRPATLVGKTSLGQLAALLARADLVLGVDSLAAHLAASAGTPTIRLYGPSDARRFGPWGDPQRQRVVRAGVACSPCGVFSACPRGLATPECMEQIAVARVLAEARQVLRAPR